ncbi:hypothetical protein BH20ACT22_BH20ACT22_09950 [soil metagenome]
MDTKVSFQLPGKDPRSWKRLGEARIPSPFTARFEFPEDHAVEIDIAMESGAPVANAIRIERNRKRPLTGTELRHLPLRDLVNVAVGQAAVVTKEVAPGIYEGSPATADEALETSRQADRAKRRRTMTDEHLEAVAQVYRATGGDRPRDAVMDEFQVSPAMASRYIKLARERGFLGAAPGPGKAGEK